jgi:ABC-type transporter Mla subunit MlaD
MGNMTITKYRSNLRLDLKDSGALWSDAEIDRCVQRAVDDLSRLIPLEEVYETTLDFEVTDESFTTLAAASATAIVNAQTLVVANGSTLTIADNTPDQSRPLTLTVTDTNSSITSFTIIIKGYDSDGQYIEESFYYMNGLTQTGKKYFKYVSEVEVDEITGEGSGDTCSIGTASVNGVWIDLDNKPIKPETETVTDATGATTYTRDTDYEMDYINGRIRLISGTTMSDNTAHLIDYTKSKLGIDISPIIPVITKVVAVEYPVDNVPQTFVSFNIWEKFLHIGSPKAGVSQSHLTDKEHIAVYYERPHKYPNLLAPSSYEDFLDQVVSVGSAAYMLLMKAYQYEHQAVTDLVSARTALGLESHTAFGTAVDAANTALDAITAFHTKIATALDAIATALGTINYTDYDTAVDAANATLDGIATLHTAIATALSAIATQLGSAVGKDTAVGTALDAATTVLDTITALFTKLETALDAINTSADTCDGLHTAVGTAQDAANTALDTVAALFTEIETALDAVATALGKVETYLTGASAPSTLKYLTDGDAYLNTVNVGQNVAENLSVYAQRSTEIGNAIIAEANGYAIESRQRLERVAQKIAEATGYISEASSRLYQIDRRIAESGAYATESAARKAEIDGKVAEANGYLSEAQARLNNLNALVATASGYAQEADARYGQITAKTNEANGYIVEAQTRLSEMQSIVAKSGAYDAEAKSRIEQINAKVAEANGYLAEGQTRLAEMQVYQADADRYITIADRDMTLADRFRTEGQLRLQEFQRILGDRAEYRKRVSSVALRQSP